MPNKIPRLDILLYAHDGRGLGHVSRTIAIDIALRRLFPELRVLLLSGCSISQEFIGSAPLDWIKLPSYETVIKSGKSAGIPGKSNFEDRELGTLRGEQIRQIVTLYRPRVVLADHSPQGKHRELLPALQARKPEDVRWVLGIRGVVGQVKQVSSALAASVFKQFYTSLLWYGDSQVLGDRQLVEITSHFGISPLECGYVAGLKERIAGQDISWIKDLYGTISVPWFGEKTAGFLRCLYSILDESTEPQRKWILYLDQSHPRSAEFTSLFSQLPSCQVEAPGRRYLDSLQRSRCAIIYGGYNSLMDVLSLALPALVILRDMHDNEQQDHLERLMKNSLNGLVPLNEDCQKEELTRALETLRAEKQSFKLSINLDGAEKAAKHLMSLLEKQ